MRIGILTFHLAINYGAVLQAYALEEYLNDKGYEAELIDYYSSEVYDYYKPLYCDYKVYKGKSFFKMAHNFAFYKKNNEKMKNFRNFVKAYLKKSNRINDLDELKKTAYNYDCLITGSDQVWSPNISIGEAFTVFILDFIKSEKIRKISYAASIGENEIDDVYRDILINSLNDYHSISVRENSAKKILNREDIEIVLDPTFLITKENWNNLADKSDISIKEKYIFVYMLQKNSNLIEFVNALSKEKKLKIVYLNKEKYFKKNAINYFTIGPESFLKLIKNAEYVVTNSFHGMVFSILFERQFITFLHSTKFSRQIELLKKFNLEDYCYLKDNSNLEKIDKEINYSCVNKLINEEIKKSISFLEKALM